MAAVRKILEEIKWGISPEVLAKKHTWEELSGQDPEELLNFARYQRDSQQAYNLLVYLFRISRDKDLWFSVEVLSQALQHPAMSSEDRNTILRTMRSRLDRIKDEVTARQPNEEKIRKYWLLEASYYAIYGSTLAESERIEEAVENYQIAEGIFQQLGLTQQAENYNHKIQRLSSGETRNAPGSVEQPERPSPHTPPLSASFRGTMELVAAGRLPPEHSPFPAPEARPPEPEPPDSAKLPAAFAVETPPVSESPEPVETAPFSEPPAGVEETQLAGDPETFTEPEPPAPEPAAPVAPIQPPEIKPDPQLEAAYLEIVERTAEKTRELAQVIREIEEQSEMLKEVQLDIRMYQERRTLLSREVQNLEKKAAYLKELCDRLERKSKPLEKGD